ncbi:hypothetical protein SAMN05444417_2785 [Wenxinia saemankumensis]|uniref:Uncharacterized protein n=2 Tax=Wenxinia saemankumensis TaxID=1447782 RepID=A0A1M6GKD8_9RHOB|nr:hypothetical protein SAMN05444417_2785 [Wenxinia saemankumensis]
MILRESALKRLPGIPSLRLRLAREGQLVGCPHYGRFWYARDEQQGQIGPMIITAESHEATCARATPEERRAIARLDEDEWRTSRPGFIVDNDHSHSGFGGEPVWPRPARGRSATT